MVILKYGEKPREGAKRALKEQLMNPEELTDSGFLSMQSGTSALTGTLLVFEARARDTPNEPRPKEPFTQAVFRNPVDHAGDEIAEDHVEVIR